MQLECLMISIHMHRLVFNSGMVSLNIFYSQEYVYISTIIN